jgi:hypothetical protein
VKPELASALQKRPPDRQIELVFADGRFIRGYPVLVHADSVLMRRDESGGPVSSQALATIVAAREWRSNAGRGFGWGATSGAVIVGSFGLLMGAYLSSINDSDDSDLAPLCAMTFMGLGAGALAGGALGGGVGALSSSWVEFWPQVSGLPEGESARYAKATRLGLWAGAGRSLLDGYEVTRFAGQVSLGRSLGRSLSLGPELGYFHFNGTSRLQSGNGTYVLGRDSILKIGLAANYRARRPGVGPFATAGIGWFISDDAYLGAHAGGGLRWQYGSGHDLEFDVHHHFSFTDVSPGQVSRFWTLGLGFGFDL